MLDDDDWTGTPPEGHYRRDQVQKYSPGRPPLMIGGAALVIMIIVVIILALTH